MFTVGNTSQYYDHVFHCHILCDCVFKIFKKLCLTNIWGHRYTFQKHIFHYEFIVIEEICSLTPWENYMIGYLLHLKSSEERSCNENYSENVKVGHLTGLNWNCVHDFHFNNVTSEWNVKQEVKLYPKHCEKWQFFCITIQVSNQTNYSIFHLFLTSLKNSCSQWLSKKTWHLK